MKEHYIRMEQLTRIGISDVLDIEDAAVFIKRSESRLRHLVADKMIPHYKNEFGKIYFRKEELQQWMLGDKVMTQSELQSKAVTHTVINKRRS